MRYLIEYAHTFYAFKIAKKYTNIRNNTTPNTVNVDIPLWAVRALAKMKPSHFDWQNAKDILHNMANELLS